MLKVYVGLLNYLQQVVVHEDKDYITVSQPVLTSHDQKNEMHIPTYYTY